MQKTNSVISKTVGEIVAEDYRTSTIFEKYGMDFCCGGKSTLSDICREKGLDPIEIHREIENMKDTPIERNQNYAAWTLSFLAEYIVHTHHAYLKENLGQLKEYTDKIAHVHGDRHPEVVEIATIFAQIATDMLVHLREEEEVCFPAIKRVEEARKTGIPPAIEDLETIRRSLERFSLEHEEIGEATHKIRHLAKAYTLPEDACNTFMLTYRKLQEFEEDLHKHVHLENNILFPKVAKM